MADLLAGTTILGLDTPVTVQAEEATAQSDITSTSFAAGSPECSTTFTAATTGRAMVTVYGVLRGDGTNEVILSFDVYEGTDDTGTAKYTGSSTRAARYSGSVASAFEASFLASGLTAGATHFARTTHRVTGGTTCDVIHRRLIVAPAT